MLNSLRKQAVRGVERILSLIKRYCQMKKAKMVSEATHDVVWKK